MKAKHIFYTIFALGFLLTIGILIRNIITRENYRTMRTIGMFPLGFRKKQKKGPSDIQRHKYSGYRYLRHKRRYNFLAQRNAEQRQ